MVIPRHNDFTKMIINQIKRDQSIADLLDQIVDMYRFMTEKGRLQDMFSQPETFRQMSAQMLDCSRFIEGYSARRSFGKRYCTPSRRLTAHLDLVAMRLITGVASSTDAVVKKYMDSLEAFKQRFMQEAIRDTKFAVLDTQTAVFRIVDMFQQHRKMISLMNRL